MPINLYSLNNLDCLNVLSIGIFLDLVVENLQGLHVGGLFPNCIGRTRHLMQILMTSIVPTHSCHSKMFVMP